MDKHYNSISKYNIKITWIVVAILGAVAFVLNIRFLSRATAVSCILDGVRINMYMANSIILFIIISFWHMHIAKDDFASLIVVRYHNRAEIWLKQCKRIAASCAMFSLYIEMIGVISGIQYSDDLLNWDKTNSYFSIVTQMTSEVKSWQVLIGSFVNVWLAMTVVIMIVIGSYWLFNTYIWGMCLLVATSFTDSWTSLPPFFLKRFIVSSKDWCSPEIVVIKIICLIVIAILIVMIGCFISRRKEFIGNNAERK
ncbi:hypothetical protein [[Clostridium] fimetarium]|uniref:ABC-2 family transporter protein n=1 Tax=[Clostridium] fimetarium TaxID=99656 RepID=A0A1I0NKF8_9FIRM|nr:hypothetical protein [[Clostridium] fimetarium]SEW01751.1 hypothetical protein SAMN05421659_103168 [[Clostridium] fimetarium]